MPGILDRSEQIINEWQLTKKFGKEIQAMSATDRSAAQTDLLPALDKALTLNDLQAFNEKTRKWIDAHPQP